MKKLSNTEAELKKRVAYKKMCIPVLPFKDRILDSILIREYKGQREPLFWHKLRSFLLKNLLNFPVCNYSWNKLIRTHLTKCERN